MTAFALFATTHARSARAQAERALVIIVDPDGTPITLRLEQEIEALGFDVEVERAALPLSLNEELVSKHAVAAIEIRAARPGSIELLVIDPKSSAMISARLPIEAARDPAAAELVTTRTVELLRATRLTLNQNRTAERAPPSIEKPRARTEPARAPSASQSALALALGAGPACVLQGGWQPALAASAHAALFAADGWGAIANFFFPLLPARIGSAAGGIDGFEITYRLGAAFEAPSRARVSLRTAAGAELSQLRFVGHAEPPFVNGESHLLAAGPWISLAAGLRVVSGLRLLGSVDAAWSLPRSVVRFAGHEERVWGRPSLTLNLGVEWYAL